MKESALYIRNKFTEELRTYDEVDADNEENESTLCKWIRQLTPTIPDIDMERYLCPECGKRVGGVYDKKHPERCIYCRQVLDWGFLE